MTKDRWESQAEYFAAANPFLAPDREPIRELDSEFDPELGLRRPAAAGLLKPSGRAARYCASLWEGDEDSVRPIWRQGH